MREITRTEATRVSGGSFLCDLSQANLALTANLFKVGFFLLGGLVLMNCLCSGAQTPPTPAPTTPTPAPTTAPEPPL
ncbi:MULTISPECIES: hypothetical protein [Erwinia]|uniref:Uncharacterized protein n=1 Tax=Erwinia plantamica TaxID=3237104 RepID=A0ABW7CNB7_9GAMM|nr:hypothetical protein [Erwinia sp. PsM31]MDN4626792.1 hypothetical protein [Erwinia sp. PsM31]